MKRKKIFWRRFLRVTVSGIIICSMLFLLQRLLVPKYSVGTQDGAMIAEYYDDAPKHNLIIIGDSEMYENISPLVLWQNYGINCYIRGSAQQLIWQSCYLLEDTLRHETPEAVIINITSMQYAEPQKESYNRMTLEGMRWSTSKVKAIFASMTEEESFWEYVFPLLRYHSRWNDLSDDDFRLMFSEEPVSLNGYMMQVGVKPAENVPEGRPLADYTFSDTCYEYLDKITALCKEHGVELILMKSPSVYPVWYDEWDAQMKEYAQKNQIKYLNCVNNDEIGLNFRTDTFDGGLHLNVGGAEIYSNFLGKWLQSETGISDLRDDAELSKEWEQKAADYDAKKSEKYKELAIDSDDS